MSFSSSVHCIINTYLFPRPEPEVFIGTMVTNPFSQLAYFLVYLAMVRTEIEQFFLFWNK